MPKSFSPFPILTSSTDMVEGQNRQASNLMSLHAGPNCTTAGTFETGTLLNSDCYQYSPTEYGSGCGVSDKRTRTFGKEFNTIGGGVFATEWTDEYIRIWFFPRWAVPDDIEAGAPEPSTWGKPAANFEGSCDFGTHFLEHQVVFDTTFCGSWAGLEFALDPHWFVFYFPLFPKSPPHAQRKPPPQHL